MQELELKYSDAKALHRAYMPFINKGGLFIKSDKPLPLGEPVRVTLVLPDDTKFAPFDTHIVWTASEAVIAEGHTPGYAIQIAGDQADAIDKHIQNLTNKVEDSRDW